MQAKLHRRQALASLVFAIGVSLGATALAAAKPAPAAAPENLGALEFTTLEGKSWQAKNARGKFVVLNFWATWCKPCIKEMPEFQALSQRSDVAVLGLAYEESTAAELTAFLAKLSVTYPNVRLDLDAGLPAPLSVPRGLPTTLVYDKNGALLKKFIGPVVQADLLKVMQPAAAAASAPIAPAK